MGSSLAYPTIQALARPTQRISNAGQPTPYDCHTPRQPGTACSSAKPRARGIIIPYADALVARPSMGFKLARFEWRKNQHENVFSCMSAHQPTHVGRRTVAKLRIFMPTPPTRLDVFDRRHAAARCRRCMMRREGMKKTPDVPSPGIGCTVIA